MNQEKIGKFIAQKRKEKKLTQEQLAAKLGVTDKSVSRWENGRSMPDLSLFSPLSEELGVNVNDLMNGEIVGPKVYQETFEKNVVNTISKIDRNNYNWNILTNILIGICTLFLLWAACAIFYHNYKFELKYDAQNMAIEKQDDGDLLFKTASYGNVRALFTTYDRSGEKIGLIFVYFEQTLDNKYNSQIDFTQSGAVDLTDKLSHGSGIIVKYSSLPNNYKVYYTNVSFKKIAKANNDELKKIIDKSDLMYENE